MICHRLGLASTNTSANLTSVARPSYKHISCLQNQILQRQLSLYLPLRPSVLRGQMSDIVKLPAAEEKSLGRNPHRDFHEVQASRPDWTGEGSAWNWTKTKEPEWKYGQGANDGGESLDKKHVEIDPYEEGRPSGFNYKLLISAIVPRFIGFVSTQSKDGSSTNLAPFSYTTVVNHDPPIFVVGYSGGFDKAKDSLRNLSESGECVINVISEHFVEAANACSINAPYGVSEWEISGLHPAPSSTVKPQRVKEAIFAIEGKLVETKEFESRVSGKKTGVIAIIEGTRFWAREDAINEDKNLLDPAVLKPISRLGGITYGRTTEGFELLRPDYETAKKDGQLEGLDSVHTGQKE